MDKTLTVSLSRTFDSAPLAIADNLPGGGAELQPAQLRALAGMPRDMVHSISQYF